MSSSPETSSASVSALAVLAHSRPSFVLRHRRLIPYLGTPAVRTKEDSGVPCDLLLLRGSAIVNEAMLSGESTPLLKESVELRPGSDRLDIDGVDRNSVLYGGTKVLQSTGIADSSDSLAAPDGGCLAVVLRTGFGTSQGQLIRTMIFSTETVSANNLEAFLFIGFLLVFALAASGYVWVKGEPPPFLSMLLSPRQDWAIADIVNPRLSRDRPRAGPQAFQAPARLRHHHHFGCPARAPHGALDGRQCQSRRSQQVL